MKTEFTKQDIIKADTCYELPQIEKLSFINNKVITLRDIIDSEIPIKDKYWWACKKCFSIKQNQEISIIVAECVIEIYEKEHPDGDTPRKAIEAAKEYLKNPNVQTANAAYVASSAANAAANAAAKAAAKAAANAAANAAYAAAYAVANAVANAANAAYAAANAANATEPKKNYKDLLLMILVDYVEQNKDL